MIKLFQSTNEKLRPFETRYGCSLMAGQMIPVELPLKASLPVSEWIGKRVVFSSDGKNIFSMVPKKIGYVTCSKETSYGKLAVVHGIQVITQNSSHIFYDNNVEFCAKGACKMRIQWVEVTPEQEDWERQINLKCQEGFLESVLGSVVLYDDSLNGVVDTWQCVVDGSIGYLNADTEEAAKKEFLGVLESHFETEIERYENILSSIMNLICKEQEGQI